MQFDKEIAYWMREFILMVSIYMLTTRGSCMYIFESTNKLDHHSRSLLVTSAFPDPRLPRERAEQEGSLQEAGWRKTIKHALVTGDCVNHTSGFTLAR